MWLVAIVVIPVPSASLFKWAPHGMARIEFVPSLSPSLAQSESGALISLSVDGRNWQEIGVLWAAQMCIIGTGDR